MDYKNYTYEELDKKYLTIVLGALALILLLGIFSTVGTVDLKLNEIIVN